MKRQSKFTPAFLKIAIPFYLVIGVLLMGIGAAKSNEQTCVQANVQTQEQTMVAPSTFSQVANSEIERD